jgi:enoyl-CoA hydratase
MDVLAVKWTCFTLSEEDGVCELTLSRPDELNTMTRAFWNELPQAIEALNEWGTTRALIISSTGRHFTAGMDLSVFENLAFVTDSARAREHLRQQAALLQKTFSLLEQARFPVIAAVQGGCIGGGLDMACACDLRLAVSDAFFCIQEINIGMMADLGTLQRLPKLLPEAIVRELAYTGDRLSANNAYRLGFVNHVYDTHEAMMLAARSTARRMAQKSPLAIAGSKEAINFARDYPVDVALKMTSNWQAGMLDLSEIGPADRGDATKVFDPLVPIPTKF